MAFKSNPFTVHPRTIISLPWLRTPRVQRLLDEVLSQRTSSPGAPARRPGHPIAAQRDLGRPDRTAPGGPRNADELATVAGIVETSHRYATGSLRSTPLASPDRVDPLLLTSDLWRGCLGQRP